jgi:Icc-related predicted phosphoesterase
MKISVCSDIHLEFGDIDFDNTDSADVLILGGDILVATDIAQRDPYGVMGEHYRSNRFHDFFQRCAARFPHVILIAGNHEHYNGDFATTIPHLKDVLGYLSNLHILDKETWTLDDVTFIGGTLWTDMNQEDPETLAHIRRMMNDFRCVANSKRMVNRKVPVYKQNPDWTEDGKNGSKYLTQKIGEIESMIEIGHKFKQEASTFSPEDAVVDHRAMFDYVRTIVEGRFDQKFVVVGHHAPSRMSTHPRYKTETIMNGGYSSSLDEYIIDHPQIKLWTHGHTHEDFDYLIGSTRVVCNPRGYINYEPRADNFKLVTVEI